MKYNEIIHVSDDFIPVFDLENEETDQYWPLFIPNEKFRNILHHVIDSLNPNNQIKPVWLQGTYGTGKTHATSVIKHLICDEEFPDYDLNDSELTGKLLNFREKTKVFPIVLKGTSNIDTSRRFELTIQNAVKKALKKNNINISVPSEFEHMRSILNEYPLKQEDIEGTSLELYSNEEIIYRLEKEETDILIEVENIFMSKGIATFTQENIVDWLINVRNKLKDEFGFDYLMIFWDEFTGALNKQNAEDILLQIQNIAEADNKGLSLLIVSHRTRSSQLSGNQELIDKVMDRFEPKFYRMEPVATYELMERSIAKEKGWEKVKNSFTDVISPLIEKICETEGYQTKKALENLYPIHPYTAFLATFVAQEIGSTERSIFKFLHDDIDYGFRKFINTFSIDERYFLTADYLWDFFYNDFEQSEDEKIASSVKKYKLHFDLLESMSEEYLVIFKVVLLLNILYKIADINAGSLAIPSENNIKNVFVGSIYESDVDNVLEYIDKNGLINKTPDGLFELTTNHLPPEQVNLEKEKLRKTLKLDDLLFNNKSSIVDEFKDKILRESDIEIYDATIAENRFVSNLEKGIFKKDGHLHLILFLCKTNDEKNTIIKVIRSVMNKCGYLNDIIVVVSEAVLGEENYDKYLEYRARSKVSEIHNYTEDVKSNEDYANKIIENWVIEIKNKFVSWYLNEEQGSTLLSNFFSTESIKLSKSIFSYGLENINGTLNNRNLWPQTISQSQAEKYIVSNSIEELNNGLNSVDRYSQCILENIKGSEKIVDDYLNIKPNVSDNHPIVAIQNFVDNTFEIAQSEGQFNLGIKLMPLIEPPYGLYPSKLNIAAFSFTLRKYVNKLYDAKGNSIDDNKMKNLVKNIFEFWSKGKKENELLIRFGSENEKKLSDLLNDIFDLELDSDQQSISTVRWEIKDWIKFNKIPLWLLEYSKSASGNQTIIAAIDILFKFLKPKDNNIPDTLIQECYEKVNIVKADLKWIIKEDFEELFKKFILSVDESLSSDEIKEIVQYLIESMPEEIYDWDKTKVENEIFRWIRERDKRNRLDPNLNISVDDVIITASLNKEATGFVSVVIGDKGNSAKIIDGVATIDFQGLEGGMTYSATVSYDGDERFKPAEDTVEVKPKVIVPIRKNPNLKASADNTLINVSLDKEATGFISVNIGSTEQSAKINDGVATIDFQGLEGGMTYSATVSYDGDDKFTEDKYVFEFKTNRKDPNMDVSVEDNKITVSLDKEVSGNILIKVDNKEYSKKIINGVATIDIPNLEGGMTYSATVSYEGDNKFINAEKICKLEIEQIDVDLDTIQKTDAKLLKDALINALKDNKEITIDVLINYLGID